MIKLRDYQEEAVTKLKNTSNNLLALIGNKTIVFKAPTGSGKTVMMAEFLKRFVENRIDDMTFAFIWTAPRQLHTQSKDKLEKYFADNKALRCVSFEELTDRKIDQNEILFLNWESINKKDNIYIRDNEQNYNLSKIIENTIEENRTIILIIDESHYAAKTETSQDLIQMLQSKVTIEVSATPHFKVYEPVTVYREKVIAEEMIKKCISINPEFKNISISRTVKEVVIKSEASESTNEFVVKTALAKRKALSDSFDKIGSDVNPLMLIQLPDHRRGIEDLKDEIIEILKTNHSITIDNGKLAVYLSEDKENLETITRNDSDVEVMIFKQAIALGWDCPRAAILVLFRDWKSIIFSIQTVGRILRMPELKHYSNDELNTGFVYTNLNDISIQEDLARDYITFNYSKRKEDYENIELRSVHSKRFREETRLTPNFINLFLKAAKELDLKNNIITEVSEIKSELITDGLITDPDKEFEHLENNQGEIFSTHKGETIDRIQTEKEIQHLFDLFVIDSLTPLAPESRSIGRVKDSIYRFFKYEFPMQFEYNGIRAQMIVLDKKNNQHFIDTVNRAKELYFGEVEKGKKELVTDEKWDVPESINYNDNYSAKKMKYSIMLPFYEYNSASQVEKEFAEFLNKKLKNVKWWFKNGERDGTFFAVPYTEKNQNKPFYIDWIIKFTDGKIGLFDTKSGITAETANAKAEGLAKYIKEENKKGKKLFGGIVINKDGSWRYNDNLDYEYDENNLKDWKFLS